MTSKLFYKLYFLLYVVFCLWGVLSPKNADYILRFQDHPGWVIAQVVNLIAGIGLYLFAFEKKWLPLSFWKIFSPICILVNLLGTLISPNVLNKVMAIILLLPLFMALLQFSYGKKRP